MPTNISWVRNPDGTKGETWNPVTGCTKVSPGCAHCYIERTPPMRVAGRRFVDGKIPVTLHPDGLETPLHWKRPRMVFVPSMGDLFHEDVPTEFIDSVFAVMGLAPTHTFQVLTKRPERMRQYLLDGADGACNARARMELGECGDFCDTWPLPNVWLGVSAENQARADERYEFLRDTPAAVRFYSLEPLLGSIPRLPLEGISWVICGGESGGPPERRLVAKCECRGIGIRQETHDPNLHGHGPARPPYYRQPNCMLCGGTGWRPKPEALEWVRDIRDQCQVAGVPFWFKQWGPRAGQGTMLDGREHKEMLEVRA